jgi:S-adenosylmethionine decarboxylase
MSSDALFQLGMDLDHGSSTAQTEEKHSRCASYEEERKDFFCERDGVRYAGTHLIIDLVRAERLDDLEHIEQTLRRCIEVAGATLLHIHLHHFTPNGGVSGVAVLAESHISIHSWPEYGYAALDVFMCGATNPRASIEVLREAFSPKKVLVKEHLRGKEMSRWTVRSRTTGSKRRSTVASVSA